MRSRHGDASNLSRRPPRGTVVRDAAGAPPSGPSLERTVIARAGAPVAKLRPVRKMKKCAIPLDDPLLRVDEYSCDGPIDPTTNPDIDSTVCGV